MDTLLVKHLPNQLEEDDHKDLLSHFGATQIKCIGKKGLRGGATAFAKFDSHEEAKKALQRLHQLEVMGYRLVVEFAKKSFIDHDEGSVRTSVGKEKNADSDTSKKKGDNSEKVERKVSKEIDSICAPLNIDYQFNPKLVYRYPKPSVTILTNIANALASVPKFYVQVLHLMNKMNIPAPFGAVTPTPPLPAEEPPPLPPPIPTEPPVPPPEPQSSSSSEESELETDSDGDDKTKGIKIAVKRKQRNPNKPRKRKKLNIFDLIPAPSQPKLPGSVVRPQDVFEQSQNVAPKKIALKVPFSITEGANTQLPDVERTDDVALENKSDDTGPSEHQVVESVDGFGKIEPVQKPEEKAETEEPEEEWGTGKFISSRRLRKGRLSRSEMDSINVYKRYQRGDTSTRLYIKNVSSQATEKDLHYIYGRYINWEDDNEKNMFDVRLMKEGRMRGQAFVTLANDTRADEAVEDTNGFVLNGKPLVVQFARSAKPKEQPTEKKI